MSYLGNFKLDFNPNDMIIPSGDNPEKPDRVIDGDTVLHDGQKIRLAGISAREVARTDIPETEFGIGKNKSLLAPFQDPKAGFKAGDVGGEEQSDAVRAIIKDAGGIDRSVFQTDAQGNPIRTHDRVVGDVMLKDGTSLRGRIIEGRLASLTENVGKGKEGATREDFSQQAWGDIQRERRRQMGKPTIDDMLFNKRVEQDRAMWGGETFVAREKALTAAEYGANQDYYSASGPSIQRTDETSTGEARDQFSTGFSSGLETAKQSLYGLAEMLGPKGSDLETWAKAQGEVSQENQQNMARIKTFLTPEGDININSFNDFAGWLGGNFAQSLPQMGIILGASALAPASLALGTAVSVGVPALMFAGNVYLEQDETDKDAGRALLSGVAQASLEKIGLAASGVLTKPLDLMRKEGLEKAAAALAKKDGITKSVAEKKILAAIKETSSQTLKGLGQAASGSAKAFGGEALTEMGQTGLEHWGKTGEIDLSDVRVRRELFESGIAGGAIGTGMHGTLFTWDKLTTRPEGSAGKKISNNATARDIIASDETIGLKGEIPTVREIAAEAENLSGKSLEEQSQSRQEREDKFRWGVLSRAADSFKRNGFNDVWQSWAASTFGGDSTFRGKYTSALSDMFGFTRHLNGGDIDTNRDLVETNILRNFGTEQEIQNRFGLSRNDIAKIYNNTEVVAALEHLNRKAAHDPRPLEEIAKEIDFEGMLGTNAPYAKALIDTQAGIEKAAKSFQAATGIETTADDVLKNRPFDKNAIRRNKDEFVKLVAQELKVTSAQAAAATEKLMARLDIDTLPEAFSGDFDFFGAAELDPKLVKEFANISPEKFSQFISGSIFDNVASMASRGASIYVNKNYLSKIPALIDSGIRAGEMTEEQGAFIAQQAKHFIQKQRGEYQPLSQAARDVMSGLGFFTSAAVLPLAAVSSVVEFAQVHRSLDPNKTQLGKDFLKMTMIAGNEFASALSDIPNYIGNTKRYATKGQRQLLEAGFSQQSNLSRQDITRGAFDTATMRFFKYTGLESVTNATRLTRLALADDAINNWMGTYMADPTSEAGKTAREQLIRIGFRPEFWAARFNEDKEITPQEQSRFERDMEYARYGFVSEAVLQPSALKRPKFYSDPYLRAFTILQGYSSTYTAKILPRLLSDLGARGTEEQRDAIRTVAVAMAMAFLALTVKESIKSGVSGDDDEDKRKVQINQVSRVVNQWGLLGQGNIIFNTFFPMIKERYKFSEEPIDYMLSKAKEASPMINYVRDVGNALTAINDGYGQGKKVAKIAPGGAVFKHLGIFE